MGNMKFPLNFYSLASMTLYLMKEWALLMLKMAESDKR